MTFALATHDGPFHADDVLSYAILRRVFPHAALIRTRDPARLAAADAVFDVGGVFDPERMRYDHHMRGAPKRPDGWTYSSAGLVWRFHGADALRLLKPGLDPALIGRLHQAVDKNFILPVDQIDNGEGGEGADPLCFSRLIEARRPQWHETPDSRAYDKAFLSAADFADVTLDRAIEAQIARLLAEDVVLAAARSSADPRILVLPRHLPWHEAVHANALATIYAVYPDSEGRWRVGAAPVAPGAFAPKKPFPEAWAGLREDALRAVTGVPDAIFCHNARFIAAAESCGGALQLARLALSA